MSKNIDIKKIDNLEVLIMFDENVNSCKTLIISYLYDEEICC